VKFFILVLAGFGMRGALIKRIKQDRYLKRFVEFCKKRYQHNIIAIGIYGSYAFGYFDKKKSDYDVFVIFEDRIPRGKSIIKRMFPKVFLQYFCTDQDILRKIREGHFSVYITLLKSARILYANKDYGKLLKKIKKINFIEELSDVAAIEYKAKFEINKLRAINGYKAAKWALPCIRKRLQLLVYIRKRKAVWDLSKVIKLNRDILTKEEEKFIINLDKKVRMRKEDFGIDDKNVAIKIIKKLDYEILVKELVGR